MRLNKGIIIGLGFLTLAVILHAAPLSASTTTDLATMVEAVAQTTPTSAEAIPRGATLYSAQHPNWPPYPGNGHNLPAWNLGGNVYLLDDLNLDYDAPILSSSSMMMSAEGMSPPGFDETGDGGGYTNSYSSTFVIDTNLLWLEIANISSGTVHANLRNATNQIYAIWETTNLLAGWQVEMELWPTTNETSVLPFTLPTLNREPLFLRAEDWTDKDGNGDGIPDWWAWMYFGNFNESATNDFDGDGVSNLDEFQNGTDPNKISFTVRLGNQNFNTTTATGTFLVLGGVPSYAAVLVNDTNLNNAVWLPYDGNISMNLGATDGVYQVWFGLKGRAADSQITWLGTDVTLNQQMPQVVITSPTNGVVAQPYLQLKGFTALPLEKVTYDLNSETNQTGLIIGQTLDTNTFSYTTNYFQCYDLLLNEGTNAITLHATDPAGNTFTTNLTVVLDYNMATNPTTKLVWPQDGLELCGSSFTLRGWTEDAAAMATATIISTNGSTNTVAGIVNRDGNVWVQDLPLNDGTNFVTLVVTNAAGFSSATNFMVVKSAMTLALTSVDGDLWLPTVSVNGTVSDTNVAIWVNGVQGTNNGDGTWRVDNVPVSPGGVASFDLSTISPGASDPAVSANLVKEDKLVLESAKWDNIHSLLGGESFYETSKHRTKGSFSWGQGGTLHDEYQLFDENQEVYYASTSDSTLSSNGTFIVASHFTDSTGRDSISTNPVPYTIAAEIGALSWRVITNGPPPEAHDINTMVKYMFHTGGFGVAGSEVVIEATGAADEIYPVPTNVPPVEITADQIGQLDMNALAYGKIKDGASVAVTSKTAKPLYGTHPGAGPYRLKTWTHYPALTDTNRARLNLGVGEEVDLSGMPGNTVWTGPGLLATNSSVTFIAPSNAPPGGMAATVIATVGSASIAVPFKVFPPSGIDHAIISSTNHYPIGEAGAGMNLVIWVAPTSVSFYRVNIMEVGEDATNISGYFTQWTPQQLHHFTADHWSQLNAVNQFQDNAYLSLDPSSWSAGSYMWNIPARWQVTGSGMTNSMSGWNQVFSIDASATMTVQKFSHSTTRTTNDVITTN